MLRSEITDNRWYESMLAGNPSQGGIVYVGGNAVVSTSTISLTSLTGGLASSASINDLVIVTIAAGVNNGTTSPLSVSGYTQAANLVSNPTSASGDDLYFYVGYKRLTAADTSVSITGGLASATVIAVQVWRNVNATTPFDVPSTSVTDILMLPSAPAITPLTPGAVIVSTIGIGSDTAGAAFTQSVMSNLVTIGDSSSTNQEAHVGMASANWTSGAYTPTGWGTTDDDGTGSGAAVTIALRPA